MHNKMLYLIVQSRWLRGSSQNGENLIAKSTRKREAFGLAKSTFYSHMEMMVTHKYHYRYDNFEIDEDNLSITLADDESIAYNMRYYVLQIPHDWGWLPSSYDLNQSAFIVDIGRPPYI